MFALEGVTLVDFGQYLAGPFGPMILGDLGADVIKVEPVTGDGMRMATKPFFGCQRGKRDIALNIKTPEGLEIAQKLIAKADVVHHNMTRGVATKLGIDYAACRAIRPDIVYCNTYAYGLAEPLGKFGGLDPLYQAAAGLEYEAGAAHEGNTPLYYRFGMCDASNALLSIVGVLLALFHRERTGEGQELWTSLLDGGVIFSSDVFLVDGKSWDRPRLDRDLTGLSALYRLYRTQDDDWIMIAAVKDSEWESLCRVLHVEHLLDRGPVRDRGEPSRAPAPARHAARAGVPHQDRALLVAQPRRRRRAQRGADRHVGRRAGALRRRQRASRSGDRVRAPDRRRDAPVRRSRPLLRDPRTHRRSPTARRSGHARDHARARLPRRRDRRARGANVIYVADDAYLTRFTN